MSTPPTWLPHPGGKKPFGINRRGLDVDENGVLRWAACNKGDTRKESIFLNHAGLELVSSGPGMVTAEYGKHTGHGPYPVHVIAKSPGKATLSAADDDGKTAALEVHVFPALHLRVNFKAVRSGKRKSHLSASKASRLLKNLNYIYSYQGNLHFEMQGAPEYVDIPDLPAEVDVDTVKEWEDYEDDGADITVFFVHKCKRPDLAATWEDRIILDDPWPPPKDEMTFAHEVGHRLGLDHPDPPLPGNLMNQTKVGDRNRLHIFLSREQIEFITKKSNWWK
jgi:hypothetical protein